MLDELPLELLFQVLDYLTPRDICTLKAVSSRWRTAFRRVPLKMTVNVQLRLGYPKNPPEFHLDSIYRWSRGRTDQVRAWYLGRDMGWDEIIREEMTQSIQWRVGHENLDLVFIVEEPDGKHEFEFCRRAGLMVDLTIDSRWSSYGFEILYSTDLVNRLDIDTSVPDYEIIVWLLNPRHLTLYTRSNN